MEENKEECSTVDEFVPRKLEISKLEKIDLDLYPPNHTHYLAYALQFGLKPPSIKSMKRSEFKNAQKAGIDKANKVTGRTLMGLHRRAPFYIPDKYGPQPVKMPVFVDRRRGRGRGPVKVAFEKRPTMLKYRKGQVYPKRDPISKPK